MKWRPVLGLGVWWAVAVVAFVGMALVTFGGRLRLGGLVFASAFVLAAVLRAVLPSPRGGGLEIRRRSVDVGLLLVIAAGVAAAFSLVRLTRA